MSDNGVFQRRTRPLCAERQESSETVPQSAQSVPDCGEYGLLLAREET